MQKWRNKGTLIMGSFLLFNLLETWFFGWHLYPQSIAEVICDFISGIGILYGSIITGSYVICLILIEWAEEKKL